MMIKDDSSVADNHRGLVLVAAGGILGALASASCCILPLVFFSLGVSGAWIGNFTQLAHYQPWFIVGTLACLGTGYWLVYRSSKMTCANGSGCARPLPNRLVLAGLVVATVLVVAALGFDFIVPIFLGT
jgi:mercuric ion transport protein